MTIYAGNVSNDPPDGPHPLEPEQVEAALRAAAAELVAQDYAATFESPAFISLNGWAFGIDHGALVGSPEDGSQGEAHMDQRLPIASAIKTFLHSEHAK